MIAAGICPGDASSWKEYGKEVIFKSLHTLL